MTYSGADWNLYQGDCVSILGQLPANAVHFSIFSPPFSQLYIYTDSASDMGNSQDDGEFFEHFSYLVPELLRVTVPGRLCAIHCKDLPRYLNSDDAAGLRDFPGHTIAAMERGGWTFHSRVSVWKCPVTERERTNNNGLLHKTVVRDSSQIRQGMADYLIVFRKPPSGEKAGNLSDIPIERPNGLDRWVGDPALDPRTSDLHPSKFSRKGRDGRSSVELWRRYAEPVWWDIDQKDVLNYEMARSDRDEKHICPLQLGLIRRCIYLWSMPGEVVLSPFAGIGSEGVVSIEERRKFIGCELKPEYCVHAARHLDNAERSRDSQMLMFEKEENADETAAIEQ